MKEIDGKKISDKIKKDIKRDLNRLVKKFGFTPTIVSIIVGGGFSSLKFSEIKLREAEKLGFRTERKVFNDDVYEGKVISYINNKNFQKKVCGIIVQLPLPKGFDTAMVLRSLHPCKDVDCLHPKNIGGLVLNKPAFYPPIVTAVEEILRNINFDPMGKNVVIVGRGLVTGMPLSIYFTNLMSSVLIPSEDTLGVYTRRADLLVTAAGVPGLITSNMIKKGAVVIDVGYELKNGKVLGDVDFNSVSKKASFITPVPGGVGPIVVASLLRNCLLAYKGVLREEL